MSIDYVGLLQHPHQVLDYVVVSLVTLAIRQSTPRLIRVGKRHFKDWLLRPDEE